MKKIAILVFAFTLIFTACEGDPGPRGPQGDDGGLIVSSAFEITKNFTAANNYQFVEPYGFEVFPSDVTLVYILWETNNGQDIWRLLTQTVPFNDGDLVYNFDFTQSDVRFFLDGTTNFDFLAPEWTQNQTFRIVVVPADNIDGIDVSNLDAVMQANRIESFQMK